MTYISLSLPPILSLLGDFLEPRAAAVLTESSNEGFDIRLGFFEHHAANGPNVSIHVGVVFKEVVCEDPSRGSIPRVARSTREVKPELLCSAALFDLRIPAVKVALVDNLFKPIVLIDQSLHMRSYVALWG